jgi:hypothetical protein
MRLVAGTTEGSTEGRLSHLIVCRFFAEAAANLVGWLTAMPQIRMAGRGIDCFLDCSLVGRCMAPTGRQCAGSM